MRFTFPKQEHLKSKSAIDALFASPTGSLKSYPLVFFYKKTDQHSSTKVGVSVPKKKHRKAVDRNRIKRLMRESYRLSKPDYLPNLKGIDLMIIYIAKSILPFENIKNASAQGLEMLQQHLQTEHTPKEG
jgi:ribonuclease P protein component, eubacterial